MSCKNSTTCAMEEKLKALKGDILFLQRVEDRITLQRRRATHRSRQKNYDMTDTEYTQRCIQTTEDIVRECASHRAKIQRTSGANSCSQDDDVQRLCRFTDKYSLSKYTHLMGYVPRLVNCVTLAEARPLQGIQLPFDLHYIASRCTNAYFAPQRFSAVQLAYKYPRCRVLIFRNILLLKYLDCQIFFP